MSKLARIFDLGVRPYREVWDLQHALHEDVREGRVPDTWIFAEHAPVVTLGRQAKAENVLLRADELERRGIDVVSVERGGDVTYHGPGQLVVYPVRRLERFREVVPLVRSLEEAVIATCARFGVSGERWSAHPGVWVRNNQIAAIGLSVRRMVSMHGLSFNVCNALDYDRVINPCGISDRGLTSLSVETGRPVSIDEVKTLLLDELSHVFDVTFTSEQLVA